MAHKTLQKILANTEPPGYRGAGARPKTKLGPYSRAQLQRLAQSGQLLPTDMVLPAGSSKWVAASSIDGLFPRPKPPAA